MDDQASRTAKRLLAALEATPPGQSTLASRLETLLKAAADRKGRDRAQIAFAVVALFVVMVLLLGVYVAVSARQGAWSQVEPASQFVLDLLSSVLLPIITLVLGYYFAKDERS